MIFAIFLLYTLNILACSCSKQMYNWENNLNNTQFVDFTTRCKEESQLDVFTPINVGVADSVVILLTESSENPFCDIQFNIAGDDENHLQIIVIEFVDNSHNFKEISKDCLGTTKVGFMQLIEKEPPGETIKVCKKLVKSKLGLPVFVHAGRFKEMVLEVRKTDQFHSMKITVTSGRLLGRHQYCNDSFEIQCTIERDTICINRALSCDRNINCGQYDVNDEDYKICRVTRFAFLWIVVIAGLLTLLIVFAILIYLLRTYIAEITDNFFIFNEDEDNKLVIRSQLRSHVWQKFRAVADKDRPCFCQTASETNDSLTD